MVQEDIMVSGTECCTLIHENKDRFMANVKNSSFRFDGELTKSSSKIIRNGSCYIHTIHILLSQRNFHIAKPSAEGFLIKA